MMKPVGPEEISALLDGELAPQRAEEVRLAIAEDQRLREAYQQLADMHDDLNCYALACQFNPSLSLPSLPRTTLDTSIWAIAFGLLAVRILAKTLAFGPAVGVQLLALALFVAWLLCRLLPSLRNDRWQVAHEP